MKLEIKADRGGPNLHRGERRGENRDRGEPQSLRKNKGKEYPKAEVSCLTEVRGIMGLIDKGEAEIQQR